MSELQTVKTAIHEIAHAKLHAIDKDAPEIIAAELFAVAREFDPEFMQKYADRQDEQITATVAAIKDGDTIAMDAMMMHISQDENTPAPIRARAADLIQRMDNYKKLNNTYSIYR